MGGQIDGSIEQRRAEAAEMRQALVENLEVLRELIASGSKWRKQLLQGKIDTDSVVQVFDLYQKAAEKQERVLEQTLRKSEAYEELLHQYEIRLGLVGRDAR